MDISKTASGGRPTHEEAAQISSRILDAAQTLFLEQGFGSTTIDQIASRAHVAKRTIYARFEGKEGVFDAVIKRHIDNNLLDLDALRIDGLQLEEKLRRLSKMLHGHVLNRVAIEMDRAITAEVARFPNLARLYKNQAAPRYRKYVSQLLQSSREYARSAEQANYDADAFLILLVLPFLRIGLFEPTEQSLFVADPNLVEERLRFFMKGIRD